MTLLIATGCSPATPTAGPEASVEPTMPPIGLAVGFTAPELTITDLEGQEIRLSELRGKPVLVNFWAVWCGFCRVELPEMQEVYQEHRDDGFVILAIDVQEDPAQVKEFVDELGLTFPIIIDDTGVTTRAYRVRGLPTSYFIGPDGVILGKQIGQIDRQWMKDHLALAGVE
jgi:thiol-disulfide isomerase/thioredoxin